MNLQLRTPFSMIISGPSNSGKTTKLRTILEESHSLFERKPAKFILFYKEWQSAYDRFSSDGLVDEFIEGMPTQEYAETVIKKYSSSCIIFDDLAQNLSPVVQYLFCVGSHHHNCSIILLAQNLFSKNPVWRTVSLNATYFLLQRNPRDPSQVSNLSKQIFPGLKNFLGRVCKYTI